MKQTSAFVISEFTNLLRGERHATGFKDDEAVRDAAAQALGRILVSAQPPDLPAYGKN